MHTDFKAHNEMLKGKDVVALKPETTQYAQRQRPH